MSDSESQHPILKYLHAQLQVQVESSLDGSVQLDTVQISSLNGSQVIARMLLARRSLVQVSDMIGRRHSVAGVALGLLRAEMKRRSECGPASRALYILKRVPTTRLSRTEAGAVLGAPPAREIQAAAIDRNPTIEVRHGPHLGDRAGPAHAVAVSLPGIDSCTPQRISIPIEAASRPLAASTGPELSDGVRHRCTRRGCAAVLIPTSDTVSHPAPSGSIA